MHARTNRAQYFQHPPMQHQPFLLSHTESSNLRAECAFSMLMRVLPSRVDMRSFMHLLPFANKLHSSIARLLRRLFFSHVRLSHLRDLRRSSCKLPEWSYWPSMVEAASSRVGASSGIRYFPRRVQLVRPGALSLMVARMW